MAMKNPPHPGDLIRTEVIEALGLSVSKAAEALKIPPTDLTVLSKKNGGKFPAGRVSRVVEGADTIPAHGSSDMPTWGPIFHSLDPSNAALTKLRISNLTKYIESMQQ